MFVKSVKRSARCLWKVGVEKQKSFEVAVGIKE